MSNKTRLDVLLVEQGLQESRQKAQALFALVHGTMITSWVKQDPADLEMARQALPAILGER